MKALEYLSNRIAELNAQNEVHTALSNDDSLSVKSREMAFVTASVAAFTVNELQKVLRLVEAENKTAQDMHRDFANAKATINNLLEKAQQKGKND